MTALWFILLAIAYAAMLLYAAMVLLAISGWQKLTTSEHSEPTTGVSILVAARNESENMEKIIHDLTVQVFPEELMEIIVIDDNSEDDTLGKCQLLKKKYPQLKILSNRNSPGKKGALQTGISEAAFLLIATVDADCRIPSEWLRSMICNWEGGSTRMLLGPVVLHPTKTLFHRIQSLEMLAIMGLTGGSSYYNRPIMANGANILFDKRSFDEVGGYGNDGNPSGDDVFTMLRINDKWPGSVRFVKDSGAAVRTDPQKTFADLWQQRKRWISKKSGYSNFHVRASALITYAANATGLMALTVCIVNFGSCWADRLLWLLLIKTILDLMLIRTVKRELLPDCSILIIIPAEIFIVTYVTLLGMVGNVRKYVWKGRSIRVK